MKQCLDNLPTLRNGRPGGVLNGVLRRYVCDHPSDPPGDQTIRTDQQNLLIRSLTLRMKKNGGSSSKGTKKRPLASTSTSAGGSVGQGTSGKKLKPAEATTPGASSANQTRQRPEVPSNLSNLTKRELAAILVEYGMQAEELRGLRKDDLVQKVLSFNP